MMSYAISSCITRIFLFKRYAFSLDYSTVSPPNPLLFFSNKLFSTKTRSYPPPEIPKINGGSSSSADPSTSRASNMNLTQQQEQVLTAISEGKSIFITGSGGTGKTFLLRKVIKLLRKEIYNPNEVFVTASTGVAACVLDGQTLHSFAGIGLGEGGKNLLLKRVGKNKPALQRWRKVKALIIDEISMVSGELFDKLEYIARKCKPEVKSPWGGIQLIVSGDFFQLPPILKNSNFSKFEYVKEFAFEADCWNSSFNLQVELTQVFRQSDTQFIELLQSIRRGFQDTEKLQLLDKCCSNESSMLVNSDTLDIPRLYPRNQEVKKVNDERLKRLGEEIVSYKAFDSGTEPWKKQLQHGMAPDELKICLGARVMLIKNKDFGSGLVNGSTGTITGFVSTKGSYSSLPMVRFDSGREMMVGPESWSVMIGNKVLATRKQIPLILAWALSIHKCQGMSLQCLQTDLSRAFGFGMVYVVLSRVRSLDGLHLSGFDSSKIKAHPKVLQFYESNLGSST